MFKIKTSEWVVEIKEPLTLDFYISLRMIKFFVKLGRFRSSHNFQEVESCLKCSLNVERCWTSFLKLGSYLRSFHKRKKRKKSFQLLEVASKASTIFYICDIISPFDCEINSKAYSFMLQSNRLEALGLFLLLMELLD